MSTDQSRTGRLLGKVAAITGATSGSGRAIARLFASEGADVVLLARGEDRIKAMESELAGSVVGVSTDVGDPESVRAAFAFIERRFEHLDILINNAALYRSCLFENLPDEDISAQVRTNLLGPIYTCRSAVPLLRAAGGGDIVNTSSEATIEIFPYMAIYAATKAAVEGLSRTLGYELESEEIRVTTLIQGVALGEGGGSTGWELTTEYAPLSWERLQQEGTVRRTMGLHGGQKVEDVAEVHLFVVTRPRGQKLDVIRTRSY